MLRSRWWLWGVVGCAALLAVGGIGGAVLAQSNGGTKTATFECPGTWIVESIGLWGAEFKLTCEKFILHGLEGFDDPVPFPTPTEVPTSTPTTALTSTPSPTATSTPLPTSTPTSTATPSPIPTPTVVPPSPTPSPLPTPTLTPLPTPSPTPAPTPTATATATPLPAPTPFAPTATPTPLPTSTPPTLLPTATPVPTPTPGPTMTPVPTATSVPTVSPSSDGTVTVSLAGVNKLDINLTGFPAGVSGFSIVVSWDGTLALDQFTPGLGLALVSCKNADGSSCDGQLPVTGTSVTISGVDLTDTWYVVGDTGQLAFDAVYEGSGTVTVSLGVAGIDDDDGNPYMVTLQGVSI